MKIVPNDYCNECRRCADLIVTIIDGDSVFATCPYCGVEFDLIYDESRIKVIDRAYVFYRLNKDRQVYTLQFNGIKVEVAQAEWNRFVAEQHGRKADSEMTLSGGIHVDSVDLQKYWSLGMGE